MSWYFYLKDLQRLAYVVFVLCRFDGISWGWKGQIGNIQYANIEWWRVME